VRCKQTTENAMPVSPPPDHPGGGEPRVSPRNWSRDFRRPRRSRWT
jgi:hypothetical protein